MTDDTTSADGSAPDAPDAPGQAELAAIPALPYYAHGSAWPAARTFAVIACRAVALFVLYQGTVWLGYLIPALLNAGSAGFSGSGGALETLPVAAGPLAATCAVAALLWWKAEWIADRMVGRVPSMAPEEREESPAGAAPVDEAPAAEVSTGAEPVPVEPADAEPAAPGGAPAGGGVAEGWPSLILSVALAAVGALVLAGGVPELFRSLFVAIFDRENDFSAWWRSIEWHGQLWAGVLKCALGFWLLLGSRGVARFVRNLRHVDPSPPRSQ